MKSASTSTPRRKRVRAQKPPKVQTTYKTALAAWHAFREIGGLDLADRDSDLEDAILKRLDQPAAATLDQALPQATTDDLVRALFGAISPFIEMFRDTLEFFSKAGAIEGRQQWDIQIGETHLDLKDFERFLARVSEVKALIEVPDFEASQAFTLLDALGGPMKVWGQSASASTGDTEADLWLAAYNQGAFPALPTSLQSKTLSKGLADFRSILSARLSILQSAYGDRAMLHARRDWDSHSSDAYAPRVVGWYAQDQWEKKAFLLLQRALNLSADDREAIDGQLQHLLGDARRTLEYDATSAQLEQILSLPVWGKRHEVYAVWIATVIVGAVPDHEVRLHHDKGRILFAFKATEIARVTTSNPECRLIGERRIPLSDPIGKGRTSAVQPDFSLWADETRGDTCRLVVEVKHYKKESRSDFRDVLTDYARAHPEAEVVLVNHGPLSALVDATFDRTLAPRCHTVGDLTSTNKKARETLSQLVCEAVGEPVQSRPSGGTAAFLIDISGSMREVLEPGVLAVARQHALQAGATQAILADVALVETIDLAALFQLDFSIYPQNGTDLGPTAWKLLQSKQRLIVLTDQDGAVQLHTEGLATAVIERLKRPGFPGGIFN